MTSRSGDKYQTESVLTVTSLEWEDAGDLVCTMVLGTKTVTSQSCSLVVVGIDQHPVGTDLLVGETAKLFCIATGPPQPSMVWLKDGSEFEDYDRVIVSSNRYTSYLQIRDVTRVRYQCFLPLLL